jgi:hypothetical protein
MNREQMELFDQTFVNGGDLTQICARSAEIIPLPIDPDLIFVRMTARRLERRQGPLADKFWRTECNRLYAKLQVRGMADAEICAEIRRFANAVHVEMQRAAWAQWQNEPRPAA